MTEAANLLRQRSDLDGERVVCGIELRGELAQRRLVVRNQAPFHATLLRAPEEVERRAAQAAQPRQQLEGGKYPRTEGALLELTGRLVPCGEERRRQMEFQAE